MHWADYLQLLLTITIDIVENKVEHFYSLRCNDVNFHDMRCLTFMTTSSH